MVEPIAVAVADRLGQPAQGWTIGQRLTHILERVKYTEIKQEIEGEPIYFRSGSDTELSNLHYGPEDQFGNHEIIAERINRIAQYLNDNQTFKITLEGHTNKHTFGTRRGETNQSLARANRIRERILGNALFHGQVGDTPEQIEAKNQKRAQIETRLIAIGKGRLCRIFKESSSQNCRVTMKVAPWPPPAQN